MSRELSERVDRIEAVLGIRESQDAPTNSDTDAVVANQDPRVPDTDNTEATNPVNGPEGEEPYNRESAYDRPTATDDGVNREGTSNLSDNDASPSGPSGVLP